MSVNYDPRNWYWNVGGVENPTEVYSSASGSYISVNDPTYVEWKDTPFKVTTLIDNEASLIEVLREQVPDLVFVSKPGLIAYAKKKQQMVLAGGLMADIGDGEQVEASTDVASLALLNTAVTTATADSDATTKWVPDNGAPVTLTAAQVLLINDAVTTFIQATFASLSAVVTGISSGSITTQHQVDNPTPAWPANS